MARLELWRRTRISSRRVIIGVANQRVVVRLVDLPWMQPNELRSSLAFQAGDYLPIPVDQTELDHAVVGELEAAGGQRLLRVLLVAAQKEMLAGHLRAVREAGLRPEDLIVEVDGQTVPGVSDLQRLMAVLRAAAGADLDDPALAEAVTVPGPATDRLCEAASSQPLSSRLTSARPTKNSGGDTLLGSCDCATGRASCVPPLQA